MDATFTNRAETMKNGTVLYQIITFLSQGIKMK